jgi:hypothetical protein
MKKHILVVLSILSFAAANAQYTATHLLEDFNTTCATLTVPGAPWIIYNPVPGLPPSCALAWDCTSSNGRPTPTSTPTPGMNCTNICSATFYLDTSYLVSPQLYLMGYTGNVFLHFDSTLGT